MRRGLTGEQVYPVVCRIPAGKVASHGQIARLLGRPRAAREVLWVLWVLPEESDVPWQRVINAQGRISYRAGSPRAAVQRAMLEDEGVEFGPDGCVDMRVYGWPGLDLVERQEVLGAADERVSRKRIGISRLGCEEISPGKEDGFPLSRE